MWRRDSTIHDQENESTQQVDLDFKSTMAQLSLKE